jgi:hypothetical protein
MSVTFQRWEKGREQGLESLPTQAIGCLPEHDKRLSDHLVVAADSGPS